MIIIYNYDNVGRDLQSLTDCLVGNLVIMFI